MGGWLRRVWGFETHVPCPEADQYQSHQYNRSLHCGSTKAGNKKQTVCVDALGLCGLSAPKVSSSQCVLGLCMSGAFYLGFVVPVEIN